MHMAGCNLKTNIVGYVGLSIDFLLHLIIKSKKIVMHTKIETNSLIYKYCPPHISLKRYVTLLRICCHRSCLLILLLASYLLRCFVVRHVRLKA